MKKYNTLKQRRAASKVGKMNSKEVYCKELDKKFKSTHEVERILNIRHSNISACCNGKRKSAGKHPNDKSIKLTWEYLPEKY